MEKKLIFSLLAFLFLIQLVSAVETGIIINTLPNHNVTIEALHPEHSYSLIGERFEKNSGPSGKVLVTLSSDVETFDILVYVRKGDKIVLYEKFKEGYASGTTVVLEMYPEGYIPNEETNDTSSEENSTINETNETNETEIVLNESGEDDSKITGSAFFGENGLFSKKAAYYVIGAIILLGAGVFIFFKLKKKSKTPKEVKVKRLSELQTEKKEKLQNKEEIIEDAERKIKEAQEDIRKIKNEDKIKEAKKKIIEDEKELMRLREGKD